MKPSGLRTRATRRDALEHRAALLEAAATCFAEFGYGVPLEEIAERAGVGRGTLYRNFRDRMALILAIFEREIDRLEVTLAPDRPLRETLDGLVRQAMRATGLFTRLAAEIPPAGDDLASFQALGRQVEEKVAPYVARAKARGELRSDITPAQFVLAMRMVNGLLFRMHTPAEIDDMIGQALDLLLDGMRP